MISIYNFLNEIYNNIQKYSSLEKENIDIIDKTDFESFINDNDKCLSFILSVMELEKNEIVANKDRANHIISTWLMGIGLADFFKIKRTDLVFHKIYYQRLWLLSSIIHDYGYFCKETSTKDISISEITKQYNLLTDFYNEEEFFSLNNLTQNPEFSHYFSYTYDEIINYYRFSQSLHGSSNSNTNERADHGICGACVAFKKYCKNAIRLKKRTNISPGMVLPQIQKIACIITASHNIFKADNKKSDEAYSNFGLDNLFSTSPIRVTKNNDILLLLSLVDTIECTKRFSQKSNRKKYLQQSTTLKNVELDFKEEALIVDFSKLSEYLSNKRKEDGMVEILDSHINSLSKIGDWTDFRAERVVNNPNKIIIKLK